MANESKRKSFTEMSEMLKICRTHRNTDAKQKPGEMEREGERIKESDANMVESKY